MQPQDNIKRWVCILLVFSINGMGAQADEPIRLAVAANFIAPAQALRKAYVDQHGGEVTVSTGSSGKLYAQITAGAPYDVFLSADEVKPRQLVRDGFASPEDLHVYAIGRLMLWSKKQPVVGPGSLARDLQARISLANPVHAPYGKAAEQTLASLGYATGELSLVYGENVAQAFHFVNSGNADFGFVARSQLVALELTAAGWQVPSDLHDPITQAMVLLARAQENTNARRMVEFILSAQGQEIIRQMGYEPAIMPAITTSDTAQQSTEIPNVAR